MPSSAAIALLVRPRATPPNTSRQLLDLQLRRRYGRRLRRGETLHHGRTEERAARVDCVNSGAQFFPRRIFQQIPMRANAHAFAHVLALVMHTE